jgi:hypothetical protein
MGLTSSVRGTYCLRALRLSIDNLPSSSWSTASLIFECDILYLANMIATFPLYQPTSTISEEEGYSPILFARLNPKRLTTAFFFSPLPALTFEIAGDPTAKSATRSSRLRVEEGMESRSVQTDGRVD